jgi:hypothetical protein
LDFKKALKDPEGDRLVKFQGSPQVQKSLAFALWQVIQLQCSYRCDN